MAYCTPDDLKTLLPEADLVRLAAGSGAVWGDAAATAGLESAITDAQARVDGYLEAGGHHVPLETVPGLVRSLTADIAVCVLFRKRGVVPEEWEKTWDRSLRTLDKIRERGLGLGSGGSDDTQADTGGVVVVSAPAPIFGPNTMTRFRDS